MKQCDRGFSPPFAIGSSSLSFAASESDPEDSFWRDFTFDFSFLTSEDQKNSPDDDDSLSNSSRHADATTIPKMEESLVTKRDFARPVRDLEIRRGENSDSFLKLRNFRESDLKCVDSKPSHSLAMVSTSHFDSNVIIGEERSQHFPPTASVLGVTSLTPVAKNAAVGNDNNGAEGWFSCGKDKEACSGKFRVSKDINGSDSTQLFSKMSALRSSGSEKSSIHSDQDDTEVDSPCWRGTRSRNIAASGTKSLNFRRCSDDLNVLSRLNPLAPQFIPSSAKKNLDKNGKGFEENRSSSLKRSLSSTFSPSLGEVSIIEPSEAGIEQDSSQNSILIHDTDESLGLVSQDSVCKTMSILDIGNEFQTSKKLDPLAPLFVPANAKLSAVVHEKHGAADHMIAIEANGHSTSAFSSSDDMLLNNVEVETHSSEVNHCLMNPYSNNVHESGKTYSLNPRLVSQVQISENTKLVSSSNKSHGPKKLNPLAPQFSLADTKPKGYGSVKNLAASDLPPKVNSSVLFSPIGYRNQKELHSGLAQSSVHVETSFNEVDTKQMGRLRPNILQGNSSLESQPTKEILPSHILETSVSSSTSDVEAFSDFGHRHGCSTSSPSPKMDVKKLLTTIHGLSELLTHVHGSQTSDSPNEQDLDLIYCTVQNLNSYINNRVQEHTRNYSSPLHSSCDSKLFPTMRKRLIRDYELPMAQNMTYSMVSGEMVPDSHFAYGVTKENGFGKVIGNYQTEEQINPKVLFYKSLWLKAKADSSLMEYETFLSKTRT